jgi:hypothetical protein
MPEAKASLIAALIFERPLCADCIATKGGLNAAEVPKHLEQIARVFALHDVLDRCRACGGLVKVYSFTRNPEPEG